MSTNRSILSRPVVYDDALITSFTPYRDYDCIVHFFSEQRGRMTAFFKRGLLNKQGKNAIQAHVFANIGFIERGDKWPHIISCDNEPEYLPLSLKIFCFRSYLCEIIEKIVPELDPAPEIFALLKDSYEYLIPNGQEALILRSFELKLLHLLGYLPTIPLSDQPLAFDPKEQRFTALMNTNLNFSPDTLKLAHTMLIAKIGSISYERGDLNLIGRIFSARLKIMGLWPLKSVLFFKEMRRHRYH